MILCLGTTPAVQRVMIFPRLVVDAVNRAVTTLDGVAGKSINVAKVLRVLGEKPVAVGFLGRPRRDSVRAVLRERGIEEEFVMVSPPTRQCVTVIDQSAGTHTELVEESRAVNSAAFEQLMMIVRRRITGCQAVVMSGTITPGGPVSLYKECTRLAQSAGAMSVVDAQGAPLLQALQAAPGLVKPNRAELGATTGHPICGEPALCSAMRELAERGAQRVVVTAGKEPTLAFDGKRFWRVIGPRIAAVNPIGSGDAFTAGLVWRLVRGDDLGEACRWASATGAANALTPLAGEVNRDDLDRLVREAVVEPI